MKVLRTIGTLAIGATAGFVACGVLTVRGVLNSERHRKALADMVSEKLSEELFDKKAGASRISYRSYRKNTPKSRVSYGNYNERQYPTMNVERGPIDVFCKNATEADTMFITINDLMKEYGYVTVGDVCDMCNLISYNDDNNYGWTHVSDMSIDGTTLHLPKPLPLND